MTTSTHIELQQIAKQAAAYITRLNGESDTFQIDGATLSAVIAYEAETGEDKGDYWTAPSWWIERETVSVEGVYDEARKATELNNRGVAIEAVPANRK